MSFEIGTTIGGYEFLDTVSSTKTGIKYRVRNTLAQRLEILRVLPRNVADDQERVGRFLREMKVHARLVHPNIVAFYNAMELERQLVMTTELVEGPTLAERLELGPLPWRDAVNLMCQALSALAFAHHQDIVHRDVAPENMIVTPEGTLKLADFGLAKAVSSPQLTQAGTILGSLKYIAPEQVKGSSVLDPRSDLYSLGVVLYAAAAGKPPFDCKSQFDMMLAHVSEPPKPPREVNAQVPEELERIILRAIAKDPAQRFQTADEFQAALKNLTVTPEKPAQAAHAEPGPAPETPAPLLPPPAPADGASAILFAQGSSGGWAGREFTVVGITSAAMALFLLAAYLLFRN